MIRRLNICSVVLLPALQPTCSSAIIFSLLWLKSAKNDLQHDYGRIADKADGSVILAQLQVSFHRESDNKAFSPIGWPFSCLQDLVAD